MKRCTRCLYPDTKPDLVFDEHGVCSACLSFDKRKTIDWEAREKSLVQLLDAHHGECIVASSGGKDSTWIALKLLEMGAHVTCVTATTCQLTPIGRANIDNLARYAKTIEVTPNRTVRARLNRLGLQLVGDISWPEHVSIFTTPFRVAADMGVGLVWFGENPQSHYGGPDGTDAAYELTQRWRSEFGGFLGLRPSDVVGRDGLSEWDMRDYQLPPVCSAKAYFFGQFMDWDSHQNAEVAKSHGMRWAKPSPASWWEFENQDNLQTGVHDYFMGRKFGYSRGCAQISVDVRAGRIGREEALKWVEQFDLLLPYPYLGQPLDAVLDHIGLTQDEFWALAQQFN